MDEDQKCESAQGRNGHVDDSRARQARILLGLYHRQLLEGCGNDRCRNLNCAASGAVGQLTSNEAAARALQLFRDGTDRLCYSFQASLATSTLLLPTTGSADSIPPLLSDSGSDLDRLAATSTSVFAPRSAPVTARMYRDPSPPREPVPPLTETALLDLITRCREEMQYDELRRVIGRVFSDADALARSFLRRKSIHDIEPYEGINLGDSTVNCSEAPLASCEDIGASYISDIGPSPAVSEPTLLLDSGPTTARTTSSGDCEDLSVDLAAVRRSFKALFAIPYKPFVSALSTAVYNLCQHAELDLQYQAIYERNTDYVNIFAILAELPALDADEYFETAFRAYCKAASHLPVEAQSRLARAWSRCASTDLKLRYVQPLQQLMSLVVASRTTSMASKIQEDRVVTGAAMVGAPGPASPIQYGPLGPTAPWRQAGPGQVLRIVYYASLLAGERCGPNDDGFDQLACTSARGMGALDSDEEMGDADSPLHRSRRQPHNNHRRRSSSSHSSSAPPENALAALLCVKPNDIRSPLLAHEEFYNEVLSEALEMDVDYLNYKASMAQPSRDRFSFMHTTPFLLTPAAKSKALWYDCRLRMLNERRQVITQALLYSSSESADPYLRLSVRRDHAVQDALMQLELIAEDSPVDFKKQLFVVFDGEAGVDEGGLSKEFYQLVTLQLFNPDYGMWTRNARTGTYWFASSSDHCSSAHNEYLLIGILFGLAIYNHVLLDVNFPRVLYRKLLGKLGNLVDLEEVDPTVHSSLQQLLEHDEAATGATVEETFGLTFAVQLGDMFGCSSTHELRCGGGEEAVTAGNREEFAHLYADLLLNRSIAPAFAAFRRGFEMVTSSSPLPWLLRADELEMLVCGSANFDFSALEEATVYDNGYNSDHRVIRWFWSIVHSDMTDDQRRLLLTFTTGTDRVPVGGLAAMKFIIARNGGNSDKLPTAHTCFNVLLLPEYDSLEKLSDRLLKAISNCKGFGLQ